jgi:D-alanyl-D-alanine carboxypeptidase (penicillin-binding protein 5/6)
MVKTKYNHLYVTPGQEARLRVKDGETMTINDLLYSALVGSANNAVESLVRVSGLSRDQFVERMNSQAKTWGATNTKFIEPSGLAPENVSSL